MGVNRNGRCNRVIARRRKLNLYSHIGNKNRVNWSSFTANATLHLCVIIRNNKRNTKNKYDNNFGDITGWRRPNRHRSSSVVSHWSKVSTSSSLGSIGFSLSLDCLQRTRWIRSRKIMDQGSLHIAFQIAKHRSLWVPPLSEAFHQSSRKADRDIPALYIGALE